MEYQYLTCVIMAKPKAPKIGKNDYRVVLGGKVYIFTKRLVAENARNFALST